MVIGEFTGVITRFWISNDFCFLFCVFACLFFVLIFKFAIKEHVFYNEKMECKIK